MVLNLDRNSVSVKSNQTESGRIQTPAHFEASLSDQCIFVFESPICNSLHSVMLRCFAIPRRANLDRQANRVTAFLQFPLDVLITFSLGSIRPIVSSVNIYRSWRRGRTSRRSRRSFPGFEFPTPSSRRSSSQSAWCRSALTSGRPSLLRMKERTINDHSYPALDLSGREPY